MNHAYLIAASAALSLLATASQAADWSDTSAGVRYGSKFVEAGVGTDISKTIFNLTHVSGDKLGSNFFTVDVLKSNDKDPAAGGGGGAQEFYGFYQRSFSLAAMSGHEGGYGPLKDLALTARGDLGTKNTGFAPRPRKVRIGLSAALPLSSGFWDVGLS